MGGTVAEAEAALGAYLRHVASGRRVAAQGLGSIYVSHLFPFIMVRLQSDNKNHNTAEPLRLHHI